MMRFLEENTKQQQNELGANLSCHEGGRAPTSHHVAHPHKLSPATFNLTVCNMGGGRQSRGRGVKIKGEWRNYVPRGVANHGKDASTVVSIHLAGVEVPGLALQNTHSQVGRIYLGSSGGDSQVPRRVKTIIPLASILVGMPRRGMVTLRRGKVTGRHIDNTNAERRVQFAGESWWTAAPKNENEWSGAVKGPLTVRGTSGLSEGYDPSGNDTRSGNEILDRRLVLSNPPVPRPDPHVSYRLHSRGTSTLSDLMI